jgi:hypothetical protein
MVASGQVVRWSSVLVLLLAAGCYYPAYVPPAPTTPVSSSSEVVVSGGDGTEVLAEGAAAIAAGADIARDQALRDALRKAVEQGVGTYVSSESRVQNFQLISDRIYSQASGYVASYRVVSEDRADDLYRVVVRARVKLDRIEDDLAAIGILVQEQGRPRILVLVKLVGNTDDFTVAGNMMDREMVETRIVAYLQDRGFPVVDEATVKQNLDTGQLGRILRGDNQAAVVAGLKSGAEIVIAGLMDQRTERKRVPYAQSDADFYQVRLSCRAVNAQSAEVLGASVVTRELPYSVEQVIGQAADSAGAELVSKILKGWKKRLNITLVHAANASYDKVERFKSEALAKLRGVQSVITRSLSGTDAVVEIVSETTSQEVFDMLGSRRLDVGFTIGGLGGSRIDIVFGD